MTMKKQPFEDTFPIKHGKFAFVMLVFGWITFSPVVKNRDITQQYLGVAKAILKGPQLPSPYN